MKRKFESYVLGGQGMGLRFVWLACTLLAIVIGLIVYVRLQKVYDVAYEKVLELPPFMVMDGEIVSPILEKQKIELPYVTAELNTALPAVHSEYKEIKTDVYLSRTQLLVRDNEVFKILPKDIKPKMNLVQFSDGKSYWVLPIDMLPDKVYSIQGYMKKLDSIIGLFSIAICALSFVVLLIDFFVFYGVILMMTPLTRTHLTIAQRGRLLVMPWLFMIGLMFCSSIVGTIIVPWWFGMILDAYSPLLNVNSQVTASLIEYIAPLWWCSIILFVVCVVIYFTWASGLSLYQERRDEMMKLIAAEKKEKSKK